MDRFRNTDWIRHRRQLNRSRQQTVVLSFLFKQRQRQQQRQHLGVECREVQSRRCETCFIFSLTHTLSEIRPSITSFKVLLWPGYTAPCLEITFLFQTKSPTHCLNLPVKKIIGTSRVPVFYAFFSNSFTSD